MANIRIGLGTEFTLKNSNLGINTTIPQERLDVAGVARAKDLKVTGVSSFTAYEGFLRSDNQIDESIDLEFGNGINASLSGEIIIGTGVTVTIGLVGVGTTGVGIGTTSIRRTANLDTTDVNIAGGSQIECLKVYNTFTPPNGGTNERPYAPKPGELYYNFDFKTIEFYDGYGWRQVDNTTRSGRGVFGGFGPSPTGSTINYINIQTLGNAQYFGDLRGNETFLHGCASSTRGIFGTGSPSASPLAELDYITIASGGNSIEFGKLTQGSVFAGNMLASSTRGIIHESTNPTTNVISFIEIATLGNATSFGEMERGIRHGTEFASPTRGVFVGGYANPTADYDKYQSIIIASRGNSIEFGTLAVKRRGSAGFSNSVRGVHGGGTVSPGGVMTSIEFLTIATGGNGQDFGDLSLARRLEGGGCASQTRGLFAGGYSPNTNSIEFITISSLGDAQDFGDLSNEGITAGLSDSHGGLGGF